MSHTFELILTIFGSVLASSGFWAFINAIRDKKDAKTMMIMGLGHDRIICLCNGYISRGYITVDEYEDLDKYFYQPYIAMGGNGTAKKLMLEVQKLPFKQEG